MTHCRLPGSRPRSRAGVGFFEREEVAMSEPGARKPDAKGMSLERERSDVLDAARPLPPDEDVVIGGFTDEEDHLFLAAILDA
jgi:hypothetical protein